MDQNASVALIASIVAVVLGALGLVGGVIGYVQGTAALRRATLIRQRASTAEEVALQARTQAEQSARTVQGVLDRLNALGVRSLGDVADLPTGPLMLPPRLPPTSPAASPAAPPAALSSASPAALSSDPALEFRAEGLPGSGDPARSPDPGTPSPAIAAAPPVTGPTAAPPVADEVVAPAPTPAPPQSPGPQSPAPTSPEGGAAEPDADPEAATTVRSATGQVTAGAQEAPPMDWAEAIRTGAIPLPSRSRGTYAAPAKRSKRAPSDAARFEIRAVGRQRYEAVNTGGTTAEQAAVEGIGEDRHLVSPVETRAKPVQPGSALPFSVLRVEGRHVAVRVSWLAGGVEEQVELPLP